MWETRQRSISLLPRLLFILPRVSAAEGESAGDGEKAAEAEKAGEGEKAGDGVKSSEKDKDRELRWTG